MFNYFSIIVLFEVKCRLQRSFGKHRTLLKDAVIIQIAGLLGMYKEALFYVSVIILIRIVLRGNCVLINSQNYRIIRCVFLFRSLVNKICEIYFCFIVLVFI